MENETYLKLKPGLPMFWDEDGNLIFGIDAPLAMIHSPTAQDQLTIIELSRGIKKSELFKPLEKNDVARARLTRLLSELDPALEKIDESELATRRTLSIIGSAYCEAFISEQLQKRPWAVVHGDIKKEVKNQIVIAVDNFVLRSAKHHDLLFNNFSLIPVRLGDRFALVGPLVKTQHEYDEVVSSWIRKHPSLSDLHAAQFSASQAATGSKNILLIVSGLIAQQIKSDRSKGKKKIFSYEIVYDFEQVSVTPLEHVIKTYATREAA